MRVAVLGGGRSSEHEVSLASAEAVREGLQKGGHEPLEVEIARDGRWSHRGEPVRLPEVVVRRMDTPEAAR